MTNREIAQNFNKVAKILEIKYSDNRFRAIAYQKASQIIENYSQPLEQLYLEGGLEKLKQIPGIGESISEKIAELIENGKLKLLDDLEKELPQAELDFLEIPSVGPKTAEILAKKLKAKNIDDLEKKLASGRADTYFKPKTVQNILRGIEIRKNMTGRLLITEALPIAEYFVNHLSKNTSVKQVDYVGSLRRMKETIGDIDIVATTENPQAVIDYFTKLPLVDHVLSKGEAKSTIITSGGAQIDLEIVPKNEYGSLMQHFTGSKEHNVALRSYALTKNYSVSEHGIKDGNKIHKFSDETDVYRFLGMDFIEPELREDRGEIEAAIKHQLPKLIGVNDIKGDLHVHSNWSDGKMTIEEIAENALKLNYEYVAISDHTIGLGIANGLNEDRLLQRQCEIEKVRLKYPKIKILSSAEVNIRADGNLDISAEGLRKLDVVIASIHTAFTQDKETLTSRLIKTIEDKNVDIIGHPSGRIIGQREAYEPNWLQIFNACVKNNTALEISAFPNRLDLRDFLVKQAKAIGVKFVINTDSHQAEHLLNMRYGVGVARRGWATKDDILNTLKLSEFLKWLKN